MRRKRRLNSGLKRLRRKLFRRQTAPGAMPGMVVPDPAAPKPVLRAMAYGPDELVERELAGVAEVGRMPRHLPVLWIEVDGLGDAGTIKEIGEQFNLHPLALEDVVNTHQRPKVERYGEHLFIVAREVRLAEHGVETEQFSLFLGRGFVLSFQEQTGDAFGPARERIRQKVGRLRHHGADYLAYGLLDALVDSYFPVVEHLGERLEELEDLIVAHPHRREVAHLHQVKRDLLVLRRGVWPLREALNALIREEHDLITSETRVYLRDCSDHAVQLIDLIETGREMCSDLMDLYVSSVSVRMNEVMKVLTIIGTIFLPLTFIAGVYGMNFDRDAGPLSMPELGWPLGYAGFWVVCLVIAAALLGAFWRLGWLGGERETGR